jgi:putative integral membrane protein (TIGR02587 family)
MSMSVGMSARRAAPPSHHRRFAIGLARAFAGAIIFGMPIFMTMEMWRIGTTMTPLRLAGFLVAFVPTLVATSYFAGFEPTFQWKDDVVDAMVAIAVGAATAAMAMVALAAVDPTSPLDERVGRIALQAVPASIGALLAQSMLGGRAEPRKRRRAGIAGQVFLAALGALFLSFNLAPTDEIVIIASRASGWHLVAAVVASLVILEAFAHRVEFRGQRRFRADASALGVFVRRSVVGYAAALAVSAAVLWVFGRFAGEAPGQVVAEIVVLGLPAAVGAAAARLIL